MEYYIGQGNSGRTFGVHEDGVTYTQIEFPNGERGSISKLEQYNNWNLQRWRGQMDVVEVEKSEIPDELIQYAEEKFE